ncbi:Major facilitator superfamily [Ilyonectria robusta]
MLILHSNKNVWGYGFSKYITPWAEKDGFIPPMLTTMALIVFFCSVGSTSQSCRERPTHLSTPDDDQRKVTCKQERITRSNPMDIKIQLWVQKGTPIIITWERQPGWGACRRQYVTASNCTSTDYYRERKGPRRCSCYI